jgi:hypothetical protein
MRREARAIDLQQERGPGERWARMMFGVLEELDGLGGGVSRRRFLQIGEKHGYNHEGWLASTNNAWSRDPDARRDSPPPDANVCGSCASVTETKQNLVRAKPKPHP